MEEKRIYIDPRSCLHLRRKYRIIIDPASGDRFLVDECVKCDLHGNPVKIGWFMWWAKSLATREFYKAAMTTDEVGND